jgi:hypothetical protein
MNSEGQRETLALLAEVWELSPDIRLGQLFAHLGFLGEAHFGRGLGYIEDEVSSPSPFGIQATRDYDFVSAVAKLALARARFHERSNHSLPVLVRRLQLSLN